MDRRVFVGLIAGVLLGLALGLAAAPAIEPVATARLQGDAAPAVKDYVVLVGALYALDRDVERARGRLAALGLPDPGAETARVARELLAAGAEPKVIVDLATLGEALGAGQPELAAYVATATPKPKPAKAAAAPTATPAAPAPTPLPPLEWDIRLSAKLEPAVKHVPAEGLQPGQTYWRLVRAIWQNPDEGHDAFHIFVNVLNKDGVAIPQPIVVENGGKTIVPAEPKPDSPYLINYPMAGTLGSYSVYVAGDAPSERIVGLGLGFVKGGKDHTSFLLTFQEAVAP